MADDGFEEALRLLEHPQSPKRRSAARRLRKMALKDAGPALLAALQKEVLDTRTWETQYQLIMALGACEFVEAEPCLQELAKRKFEATMIYCGLGDALVRLAHSRDGSVENTVDALLRSKNPMLIEGGLVAVAMLRLVIGQRLQLRLLRHVRTTLPDDFVRVWFAIAAAGWESPQVSMFLEECVHSDSDQLRRAATAAVKGEYFRLRPL